VVTTPLSLAVDHPLAVSQRGDETLERALVGKPGMRIEDLQLAGSVGIHEHRQHLAPDAVAYWLHGMAMLSKNAFDNAIADFDRALELKAGYADALSGLEPRGCERMTTRVR
jgi:hypothetical protein